MPRKRPPERRNLSEGGRQGGPLSRFRGDEINPERILFMADDRLALARRHHSADDYAQAEHLCRQILQENPQEMEASRPQQCCK